MTIQEKRTSEFVREITLEPLRCSIGNKSTGVEGPTGLLTKKSLPASVGVRWTERRKAEVPIAMNAGLLSTEEALRFYGLSTKELSSSQLFLRSSGMPGLRATTPEGLVKCRSHGSSRA